MSVNFKTGVFHVKHSEAIDNSMRLLQGQVEAWGLALQPEQVTILRRYAVLLADYAEANVIGTKEIRDIVLDHVLDSMSCLAIPDMKVSGQVIDVGSGGGLPGIPLAIAQTDTFVTLLEATEKKVKFLRHVRESLQLTNVALLNQRAEEAGALVGSRDYYDVATTRAVASLPVIIEYCAPLTKTGGWILAMKGRLEQDELDAGSKAAKKLGAELYEVNSVRLGPKLEQKQRKIAVFRKTGPTPTGYPRRIGLAKKRPLGS